MSYGGGYSTGGGYSSGGYGAGKQSGYNSVGYSTRGYSSGGGYHDSWSQGSAPPSQSAYASWASEASSYTGGNSGGGYATSSSTQRNGTPMSGERDLNSTLQAMASSGASFTHGGRGGFGGGFSGSRPKSSGFDMSKYAGYQTNKRKYEDRNSGWGGFGDRGRGGRFEREKRPRREPFKPREGREPELNLYIDRKFNFWNLPVKARVLLVSNVPQIICQPDLLYNLFSFYGDVERVKILRRKTNCALVEFTTSSFACIARDHLDQSLIRGELLVVTFSRFDRVRLPHEIGLPPDDNTQDFSGPEYQKLRRYWNEELKKNNMRKIISPTATMHISGVQPGKSPNDVKRLFENFGLSVVDCVGVNVKKKKRLDGEEGLSTGVAGAGRMFCYVQFATVDDCIVGLSQFGNSAGMRISFAKDNLETLKQNCIEKNLPLVEGDQIAD